MKRGTLEDFQESLEGVNVEVGGKKVYSQVVPQRGEPLSERGVKIPNKRKKKIGKKKAGKILSGLGGRTRGEKHKRKYEAGGRKTQGR